MEDPPYAARSVYRSLGTFRFGAGFMDKRGVRVDQRRIRMPSWSLVWVVRGCGEFIDGDGAVYSLSAGSCFQRRPGEAQSTILDPASRWFEAFVDLGPQLHAALVTTRVLLHDPPVWMWGMDETRLATWQRLIDELASASERDLPRLVVSVQALAVAACAAAAAGAGPGEDPIDAVCRDLAEHPEQRFDLRGWCRARSLDYDRFRKDFVRRLGVPPHRFRIRRRLDRACALLRAGAGVAEVAAQLGYPSPFEFSAQFRAHLGVPPSRWRA